MKEARDLFHTKREVRSHTEGNEYSRDGEEGQHAERKLSVGPRAYENWQQNCSTQQREGRSEAPADAMQVERASSGKDDGEIYARQADAEEKKGGQKSQNLTLLQDTVEKRKREPQS